MNLNAMLAQALQENQFHLPEPAQHKLISYLLLLNKWNQVYNLTSITHPSEMIYLHVIDSLSIAPFIHGEQCLDVGSGAGLPGIPLAIMNPEKTWTLIDKNNKKVRFLTQAIAELDLPNVKAVYGRCEDFNSLNCFDSIVSRAYGSLALFVNSSAHLICPQGVFIAMKGKYPLNEINELSPQFAVQKIATLDIKGFNADRHIICIQKKEP